MQAADELTELADQNADSTNSNARYMAYATRLRTALLTTQRHVYIIIIILAEHGRLILCVQICSIH